MSVRAYAITSSIIFLVVAVLHLVRLIEQWNIVIGGWYFPLWGSVAGALVAAFLSYAGFRVSRAQRISLFR